MDDDILEARKSWVDKMVAWQKEHISDRQMTLILAFVIGVLASVAGYFRLELGQLFLMRRTRVLYKNRSN